MEYSEEIAFDPCEDRAGRFWFTASSTLHVLKKPWRYPATSTTSCFSVIHLSLQIIEDLLCTADLFVQVPLMLVNKQDQHQYLSCSLCHTCVLLMSEWNLFCLYDVNEIRPRYLFVWLASPSTTCCQLLPGPNSWDTISHPSHQRSPTSCFETPYSRIAGENGTHLQPPSKHSSFTINCCHWTKFKYRHLPPLTENVWWTVKTLVGTSYQQYHPHWITTYQTPTKQHQ